MILIFGGKWKAPFYILYSILNRYLLLIIIINDNIFFLLLEIMLQLLV